MKKISLIFFVCFSAILFAGFNVRGIILDYKQKEVIIRKASGVSYQNEAVIKTNRKGEFNYQMLEDFKGVLLINIDDAKQPILLLADGKDIEFEAVATDGSPVFPPNSINFAFQSYVKESNEDNLNRILDYILSIYAKDDPYYKATKTEKDRLASESFDADYLKQYPLMDFYIKGQEDITKYNSVKDELASRAERKNIISKLTTSGKYLETTNLLGDYVSSYFMLGNNIYKSKVDLDQNMKNDLDELLQAVDVETERGQLVLTRFLDLLKAYGFNNLVEDYMKDVEGLTCEVSSVLTDKVQSFKAITKGAVIPDSKLPNGKSIHEIKAKSKILLFWSPDCPHCLKDLPKIAAIYPNLKKEEGEIIAFGADSDKQKYDELIKDKKWMNFYDRGSVYLEKYGITAFPTFILLDENNVVQGTYSKMQQLWITLSKKWNRVN